MDINKICPGCMQEVENRQNVGVCPHCGYHLNHIESESYQLQPFTILAGKYLVGKVIGEGGFGISYLGYDLNLDLPIAIKEFYPNGFVTREANHTTRVTMYSGKNEADVSRWRDSFINEARNLAKFSNLNGIVEVRDFFNENNTAYIVMEYIDGITLKSYLRQNNGKLPVDKVLAMMEPVIRSLSKVHDTGMIHRDISPDNIMITKHGGMKLLDFGAAREYAGNAEKSLSIMLKPGYAPEEQYRSRGKQGPWSDVYALSATIYKCITGVTPIESMERMREDSLKSPGELGVRLSRQQEDALMKGMSVYAENRIQSMDELHNCLYSSGKPYSPNPESEEASKPQRPENRAKKLSETKMSKLTLPIADTRLIAVGVGSVCAVVLLVFGSVLLTGNSKREAKQAYVDRQTEETVVEAVNTSANINTTEETITWEEEGKDTDELLMAINQIEKGILDYSSVDELSEALDEYKELAEQYGYNPDIGENVFRLFNIYGGLIAERVNNCNSQEPSAALYMQMTEDMNSVLEYVTYFECYSIGVYSDEIEELQEEITKNYKNRLIQNFDYYAEKEINDNGVVSRSELWSKMQGVNEIELCDNDNPEDPLRLRYEAALALYIDSEIDGTSDMAGKVAEVYEFLGGSSEYYCPQLIYRLSEEYGDRTAYTWYSAYCSLDMDFWYMSDIERKNFVYYYYTNPEYQNIREEFRSYMMYQL